MKRAAAGSLAVVALAACDNDVPTATGADLFPGGALPSTVELVLQPGQFIQGDTVLDGFSDVADAPYLLVANRFDGALDAHALARFNNFPDSVVYTAGGTTRTDRTFSYVGGRVVARVDSTASAPRAPVRLQLYALAQAWDSASVSWRFAVNRPGNQVAWRTPGGTLGPLLAEGTWTPGDTLRRDSVVWQIDSLAVRRMAERNFPGVAVVSAQPNSRLQLSRLALEARVRPAGRADTAVTQLVTGGPQTFVFSPDLPRSAGVFRAGGVHDARTVFRLALDQPVPACPSPSTTPNCPTVPLRRVTLNRAVLELQPLAVPLGFRPLSSYLVQLRRVVEPELGRLAPLGEVLASDSVAPAVFQNPQGRTVTVELTRTFLGASDSTAITLALLAVPPTPAFGQLWFARAPRLRLVYTLPLTPTLP